MAYNADPKYDNRGGYPPPGFNQGNNPAGYGQGRYPGGYNNGFNNGGMPPKPSNYLVFAILVTIFCCLPFGIVAIIYASQVDSAYNAGNYDAALASSGKAKTWCIVSVVVALVLNIIGFAFYGAALYASLLNI